MSPMSINIKVVNAKTAYGNLRLLIVPIKGFGMRWVDEEHVHLNKETE